MKRIIFIGTILVLATIIFEAARVLKFNNKLVVVFCDVGQGDGAFIRTPRGKDILIDTGPDSSILSCISKNMPFWDRKIDLIILTHFNLDHVGGIVDILNRYSVKRIAIPTQNTEREDVKNYMSLFINHDVVIDDLEKGDSYKIDENSDIKTLGLSEGRRLIEDNDSSLIQLLSYKDYNFLFTGDASFAVLNSVLGSLGNSVEVLKVPHHGSKTGLNEDSFKNFKPQIAVISSGKKNRYGHPNKEILDLLQNNRIQARRTDQEGSIKFVLD